MSHLKLVTGTASPFTTIFTEALENLDSGICIVDEDGAVSASNRRFRELLGLPADWPDTQEAAKAVTAAEELVAGWVVRVEAQGDFSDTVALAGKTNVRIEGKALPSGGVSLSVVEADSAAQRELADTVARFRALLAHMPSTISLKDADGKFLIVNEAWERDLNIPAEKMLGKTIWDAFPDADWSDSDASDALLLSGKRQVIEDEIKVDIAGRGKRVFRRVKFPVLDHSARPVGVGTINTDITDHVRGQENLRRSDAGLRQAQELAKTGYWERDFATGELYWSEPLFGFFGFETGNVPDFETTVSHLHPEDRYLLPDAMAAIFSGKKHQDLEFRVLSDSGDVRYLRDVLEAEFDSEGRPTRVFGVVQDVTDSRLAEYKLRDSEAQLRSIIDNSSSVILLKDLDGKIQYAGKGFAEAYGVPDDQVTGMTTHDIAPGELGDMVLEQDQRVIETGEAIQEEMAMPFADGAEHTLLVTKFPVRDANGNIVGVGAINTDITDRVADRQALAESEAKFRSLLKFSPESISLKDADGRFQIVNDRAAEILGLSAPDMIGKTIWELLPDGDCYQSDAADALLLTGQHDVVEDELPVDVPGRGRHIFRRTKFPVLDSDGQPIGIGTITSDETARKRGEEALRRSEAGMRNAQKLARIGNWERNFVTGDDYWSDEVFEILGLEKQPVPEFEDVLRHVHPDDRQNLRDKLDAILAGVGQLDVEFRVVMPSGEIRYVHELSEVDYDEDGKAVRCVGVIQDVTEAKLAEQAVRRSEVGLKNAQKLARMGNVERNFATGEAYWSDEVFDIFGIEQRPTVPDFDEIMDRLHPDDVTIFDGMLSAMFAGEAKQEVYFRIVMPSGEVRYAHELLEAEYDHAGNPTRCIAVIQDVTETRLAETALRDSEAKFHAIFEEAGLGIALVDRNGAFFDVNPALARMFGMPQSELTGTDLRALTAPGDLDRSGETFGALISGERDVSRLEKQFLRKNGEPFTVSVISSAVRDEHGNFEFSVGLIEDITERKRAEAALRESEQRFRSLIDNLPNAVSLKNREERFVLVNKSFETYFHTSQAAVVGGSLLSTIPDYAHWEATIEADRKILDGKRNTIAQPMTLKFGDGSERTYDVRKFPVTDASGRITGVGTISTDITDRLLAEEQLRESEAKFHAIFDEAGLGMGIVGGNGEFLDVNAAMATMFGLTKDEMVGESIATLTEPGDLELSRQQFQALLNRENDIARFDKRYLRKGSGPFDAKLTSTAVFDENEEFKFTVALIEDITERKKAETALRESEASLEQAQRIAQAGSWVWDAATTRVNWSKGLLRLLRLDDLDREDAPAIFRSMVHPDDRDKILHYTDLPSHGDSGESGDYRITLGDGSKRIFRTLWQVERDQNSAMVRITGVTQDVTDIRQSEAALRESEERFRTMIDNLPSAVSLRDREYRYVLINQAFASVYARDPQDVLGRRSHEVFPIREWTDIEEADKKLFAGEIDLFEFEYELEIADGERRLYQMTKFPVFGADGEVANIGTISTDITDRKRAEQTLRESEERFRSLIDNIPASVTLKDRNYNVLLVNETIEDWFGISPERYVGNKFGDIMPESQDDKFIAAQERVLATNATVETEIEATFVDGSKHQLQAIFFPVKSDDGEVVNVGMVGIDITDRNRTDEMLRQAQKMEVVGQLTGGVAHDFNNLLAVVIGNLEMAADELGPEAPEFEFIRNAFNAAERGASLTHHLLAFSRQQVLQPDETDLGKLVGDTTELMSVSMGEKIFVDVRTGSNLWRCRVDQVQLQNAILNLSINARDAMPSGGNVTIDVENVTLDEAAAKALEVVAGDYICLSVADDGPGIPEDVLEHVYEPFFTTKDVGEGSGLGLSMVYGFVRQTGGGVEIETGEGKGTIVRLYFPALETPAADVTVLGSEEAAETEPDATILLVEDNAAFREITRKILQSLKYRVIDFGSAEEALEVIGGTAKFDLLLSDIGLPGDMNGHDLAGFAASARPGLKIVLMSAHTDPQVIGGVIDGNVSAFIRKPHRKADLNKTLRQVLDLDS